MIKTKVLGIQPTSTLVYVESWFAPSYDWKMPTEFIVPYDTMGTKNDPSTTSDERSPPSRKLSTGTVSEETGG